MDRLEELASAIVQAAQATGFPLEQLEQSVQLVGEQATANGNAELSEAMQTIQAEIQQTQQG